MTIAYKTLTMKYLIVIFSVTLFACSNNNNITTQLLNDKKSFEDSIKDAANYELYYIQKAKEEMHASHDSLKWQPLVDSSTYYFGKGRSYKEKLKALEFSLDSLSKMK